MKLALKIYYSVSLTEKNKNKKCPFPEVTVISGNGFLYTDSYILWVKSQTLF